MNKFERELEKWNKGVLRGAQAKLAKALNVSTAIVALWTSGKRCPSKGYVAQMARLFHLSEAQTKRLFPLPYNEDNASARAFLRETPQETYQEDEVLAPQSNSVSLPFLANVPAGYPEFDDSNIIEWWTLPRRYAKGAKYLVRCCGDSMEGSVGYDDLCLIKPATEFLEGKVMLVKIGNGYVIKRIRKEKGKIVLYSDNNKKYKAFSPQEALPLGIVVRKITDVE
jgi:SOS-response transcriptional repressor LexA